MTSIYRSAQGQDSVRSWCVDRLDQWEVPHHRMSIATCAGNTHVVTTNSDPPSVVVLAGTNFNAATSLELVQVLAQRWSTVVVDVPGQPGLSAADRPRGGLAWYSRWLHEVLDSVTTEPVVVLGHSLGGGIALACDSSRIAGRALIAPAGVVRLRVTASVLVATVAWLVRPTAGSSTRLLRVMNGPGHQPSPVLIDWMTLVARKCRTSLAPTPLPIATLGAASTLPILVATGEHDVFLPPSRLRPAVARALGTELRTLPGAGHLAPEESPERVVTLVEAITREVS